MTSSQTYTQALPELASGMRFLTEEEIGVVSGGFNSNYILAGLVLMVAGGAAIAAAPVVGTMAAGSMLFGYSLSGAAYVGMFGSGLTLSVGGTFFVGYGLGFGS